MIKLMLGVIITIIGVGFVVYGILILTGVIKTKDDDQTNRFYAGGKAIMGGVGAIILGTVLFLS